MAKSFDKKEINRRFFSLFNEKSKGEIASLMGVGNSMVTAWVKAESQVPWDKLALAIELSGKSWDWMLTGKKNRDLVDETSWKEHKTEIGEMDEEQRRRGLEMISSPASIPTSPHPDPVMEYMKLKRQREAAEAAKHPRKKEKKEPMPHLDAGMKNEISLPLFGSAAAATNGQDEFYDSDEYDYVTIPAGTGMVEISGDSMEPLARDGQKVFLRPPLGHNEEPKKGDLVVVWTYSFGTTKRFFKRWGGWLCRSEEEVSEDDELILISVNPVESVNIMEHVRREDLAGYRIVAGVWYG